MATFNLHAGMDGWGNPFDVVEACQALDADVLALQEVFCPLGSSSQAEEVASSLGYSNVELPLARAWHRRRPLTQGKGWQQFGGRGNRPLRVGQHSVLPDEVADFVEGTWGLALLSRVPVVSTRAFEFGKLRRDFTHRGALQVELALDAGAAPAGGPRPRHNFKALATHAAHVTAGSPVHFNHLRRLLPEAEVPAVAAGDMNLWGPPVTLMLPGWRRAVKGRTWPSWRPHSQPDHILVTAGVSVASGVVVRTGDSDHLAVRADLEW